MGLVLLQVLELMAKELPYFKFETGAWDNGNIQICSREAKGLFIDVCSMYWARLGDLPYALALQKLCNGNKDALQELELADIIKVIDGKIIIEFLDEQLSEFEDMSQKRRKAANKRWNDANALQVQSKSNAIREEKRRGKKIKKDNTQIDRVIGNGDKFILINPEVAGGQILKICGEDGLSEYYEQNMSAVPNASFSGKFLRDRHGKHFKDFRHVWNDFNFYVKQQFA